MKFPVGSRVRILLGAGLDSEKTGTVIPPELDHRGIPKVHGAYQPFRTGGPLAERMIRLDNGQKITMFVSYLRETV